MLLWFRKKLGESLMRCFLPLVQKASLFQWRGLRPLRVLRSFVQAWRLPRAAMSGNVSDEFMMSSRSIHAVSQKHSVFSGFFKVFLL